MRKLLFITLSVFLLSSCSDMRYASMRKIKQSPTHTIAENQTETQKITSPQIKSISPQNTEIVFEKTENKPFVVNKNKKQKNKNLIVNTAKKFNFLKTDKSSNTIDTENPTKFSEKNSIKKKQIVSENNVQKGSWLWYLIVGLIFILIGSILTGIVGYILWIIGIILIVYGLLVLIEFI